MSTSPTIRSLFREKQYQQITLLCKDAFRDVNSNWDDLLIVVRSYLALGETEEACSLCERIRSLDVNASTTLGYYVAYTECLRAKGQLGRAIGVYEEAIEKYPREIGLYLAECEVLDRLGRHKEAKARLVQALEIDPNNKRAKRHMDSIGQKPVAPVRAPVARHSEKKEAKSGTHANVSKFNPLVVAFSQQEIREYQQISKKRKLKKLSKLPSLPEVSPSDVFEETLYAAQLGLVAGEYEFVIDMLGEALASEESHIRGEAYKLLGELYLKKGRHDSAEAAWLSSLEYGCTDSRVYVNLVSLACMRDDHVLAEFRLAACKQQGVPLDRIEELADQISDIRNANKPMRLSMQQLNDRQD